MNLKPQAVKEKLDSVCFIDVRTEDEFRSGHVPGAICVPLDKIECGTAEIPQGKMIVLGCQSGKRSARAKELLRSRGFENLVELEGGFSAWVDGGFPVSRMRKSIPIMRQVLISAGTLILAGTILGLTISPNFFAVPLFVGSGLIFAGVSGWCGMAYVLERMPWNKLG